MTEIHKVTDLVGAPVGPFGRAVVVDVIVSVDEKMIKGLVVQAVKNESKARTSQKESEKDSKVPGLTKAQVDLAKQYVTKLLSLSEQTGMTQSEENQDSSGAEETEETEEEKEKEKIDKLIQNLLETKPLVNSIIARKLPERAYDIQNYMILQPMFPSHMQMPIKPGEQVFVIYPTPPSSTPKILFGYWLCRIPGTSLTEDANYTHASRHFDTNSANERRASEKAEGQEDQEEQIPGFPNGNNTISGKALTSPFDSRLDPGAPGNDKWKDEYSRIVKSSISYSQFMPEVVPRYAKRPGDFVLQGSNNTLICLGEDRSQETGFGITNIDKVDEGLKGGAGTIDIVVGRGIGNTNAPKIIENTRKYKETDKTQENVQEGDIDFKADLARIYVSMNTNGDVNLFGTEENDMPFPKTPPANNVANEGAVIKQTGPRPYIIQKSDEIRVVVRQGGSIKIVKEGAADDDKEGKGRATIVIQPDGTIMIDGPKIVLGSGIEKEHGAGNQLAIGLDAKEPLVLGDSLGKILTTFLKTCLDNKTNFSIGQGPNALNPVIIKAVNDALSALGGSPYEPKNNTTLSKVGKTK